MLNAIIVFSFLGIIVFLILSLISAIKKTKKAKKLLIGAATCFVIMIIAAVNAPQKEKPLTASKSEQATQVAQTEAPAETSKSNELKVHYIDVGQGASQLIIGSTGKTILIDAGNNDKEKLVVDYLKQQNINKIDILIGTHPDADHIGGLDAVIDNFEIGKIYMPKVQSNTITFEDVLTSIQKKGLKVSTAKAGLVLDWETNAVLNMIAPVGDYSDANDMSTVIHLTFGETSFLFTGDAESKSEHDMLNSKVSLKSDVLLVGHHGSKSSTTQAFLDAVNPSCAVIQVGKNNNYDHPTAEVLKRLSDKGINTYRNDEQGNIIFTSNGKDIAVNQGDGKCVKVEKKSEPVAAPIISTPTPEPTVAPTQTPEPTAVPTQTPKPTAVPTQTPKPTTAPKQQESNVYYQNCSAVKAAGAAPIYEGEPGYSRKLDRDGDGVACEK
jgi:competence protein ComEC